MTMRVLDLGCGDGYLTSWLRDQVPDIVVDGIELHPDAVKAANVRLNGTVMRGRAEDAAKHFKTRSYDAVVAYELLEHVPDVAALLTVCERMAKPGGRVFLSTPDGAWGDGGNPRHLRALRSIDLAEIIRRRGDIIDFGAGDDGVTVCCYEPKRQKLGEIAILTGAAWEKWGPLDIGTRGLGGSETAAYRLAEQLGAMGYIVTIYGHCDEGAIGKVVMRDWQTFDPTVPRHTVISSRLPEVFDRWVNATHKVLWLHDTDCGDRLTAERAARLDHVVTLSSWHRDHVAERYPFAADKIVVSRNGITHSFFDGSEPEREQRVLYTSSPDRGLDVLLELWPQVREHVPNAELIHCYAAVYDAIAEQNPVIRQHRDRIRKLSEQDGVRGIGPQAQGRLAELMRSSLVWAHPSYCTPAAEKFCETSCIGAMEAQAAGCRVVAGNWGALVETVRTGALIDGDPTSAAWRAEFVEEIVAGLTDEDVQQLAQTEGPAAVADLGWQGVADQVVALTRRTTRKTR